MSFASFPFTVATPTPTPPVPPSPDGFTWDQLVLGSVDTIPVGELDTTTTAINRIYKQWQGLQSWLDMAEWTGQTTKDADEQQGQILDQISIQTSTGVQLDKIGELVGIRRNGLSDTEFRAAIKVEVQTLFASGTIPDVLGAIASILNDPTRTIVFRESFPAAFVVTIDSLTVAELDLILELVCDVPAAGVAALIGIGDDGYARGFGYTPEPEHAGTWGYDSASDTPGIASPWGYAVPFSLRC